MKIVISTMCICLIMLAAPAFGDTYEDCRSATAEHFIADFLVDHAEEGMVSVDFQKSEKGLVEVRPGAQGYYDYVIRLRIKYGENTEYEIAPFSLWTIYYSRHPVGLCWVHGTTKYYPPLPMPSSPY
ncbi:hypothetical protein LCGC14_1741220 [marine sediment metagenome]|uniref:Uncharacterized protein n=1 Tax=marine sediment metagenome TaxID=412755 RepID=A0A0F9K6C2_9ZZZZ